MSRPTQSTKAQTWKQHFADFAGKLSATHVFGKLGGFGVLRVATFSTFESENSALAVELILSARSQGGIGLTRCVDD